MTIPEAQYAIVRDRERQMIVQSGRYDDMVNYAETLNVAYQSTAYIAELWKERS